MEDVEQKLSALNWDTVTQEMHGKGYSLISKLISDDDCRTIIDGYNNDLLYRKTIRMERYRFGAGEYKYFNYPLPVLIQALRQGMYEKLAPIANAWMEQLNIDKKFPDQYSTLQKLCHDHGQTKPTVLILKYTMGGHNTLHQDLYGEIFFPLQAVLFLNKPGTDYQGGEFVLIQQMPRAQSKAIVLQPCRGDILLFTTNFRPVQGTRGFYRSNMKHGVSDVHAGVRHTLGIIFHDALS